MISGRNRNHLRLVLCLALIIPILARAEDWQQTVRQIAAAAQVPVRFEEHQYRFYLDAPLVSHGEMRFVPPATLIRRLDAPQPMRLLIEGDRLIREMPDGRRQAVALEAHPLIASLSRLLLALFAGDTKVLSQRFTIHYEAASPQWRMRLLPREKAVREWIRSIRLTGRDGALSRIEIIEVNDDRTVIRLWPAEDGRA